MNHRTIEIQTSRKLGDLTHQKGVSEKEANIPGTPSHCHCFIVNMRKQMDLLGTILLDKPE
jgi:hypothetical protein